MPECSSTPAEANSRTKYAQTMPVSPSADMVNDLATNPLKRGKAEIDIAPMIQQTMVKGIFL